MTRELTITLLFDDEPADLSDNQIVLWMRETIENEFYDSDVLPPSVLCQWTTG
jgi:hypothetical protein